jgi:glycosyltransferase involved in cell wall biosynthesis
MPQAANWEDPYGVPVRTFGRGWEAPGRDRIFALGVAWMLWKERGNYDLVYFLMQGLHLAAGLPVARLLHKPVVMKISGSSIIDMMRLSFLGRLEIRWLQRWAHRVLILNSGMAEEAAAAGFRRDHLLWMPNPVDTAEFAPAAPAARQRLRERLGIPPDTPAAIYVGRLAPEKELPSVLGAFTSALRTLPEALLLLVGDGPDRQALEFRARELGLEGHVRFTGRQTLAEVREWLQVADAFVLASSNEGFPCALVEAMSAGLPAVVSNIPANLQLIDDGVHGYSAALRDEASLAGALIRVLSDRRCAEVMGAAARRRVLENFATDQVLDRYESLFREALGQQPAIG